MLAKKFVWMSCLIALSSWAMTVQGKDVTPEQKTILADYEQAVKNNEIAVLFFDSAWNKGDLNAIDKYIPANAVDHSTVPGKSPEQGPASFKSIIVMFRNAMPNLVMTIEDKVYMNDRVVHRWVIKGNHTGTPIFGVKSSGKELVLHGTSIVRVEKGKIMERWANLDLYGFSIQLGLIPPPPAPDSEQKETSTKK